MSRKEQEILIIEKPASITYDEIREVLWRANEQNRKDGFVLSTSKMPPEKLKARIGEGGKCFVALDKDKLVGTISVRFLKKRAWYAKGRIADYMLAAVIPEYQGRGINSLLANAVFAEAKNSGCEVIELDTAEINKHAISVYKHQGFVLVGFKANPNGDHYSVIMAKWLKKCPYLKIYCKFRFIVKKIYIKIRFKPNKRKRFGK